MALSMAPERKLRLGLELAAQMEEAARGQRCGESGAEDMRKRREERSGPHAEMEDDVGIAWPE